MSDREDAKRLTQALVSRRSGIITALYEQGRSPEDPCPPYIWNATLAHLGMQQTGAAMRNAGGKGKTPEAAQLSAIGEALERYAALRWDTSRLRIGRAMPDAILPTDCVLYSDRQYAAGLPYRAWTPQDDTAWISGFELPGDQPVELPASMVYLYSPPPRAEDYFAPITSNGLAAGKDLTQAILGGLSEIVERDAFMITWMNRLPARKVSAPDDGSVTANIINHFNHFGVKVHLRALATDQAAFVVMAQADSRPDMPGHSSHSVPRMIGLGCAASLNTAMEKAVFELCQLRPGMATRMAQQAGFRERLTGYSDVRSIDDHPLFHVLPQNAHEFDFLDAQTPSAVSAPARPPEGETPEQELAALIASVSASGARVAYVDLTPPDIRPLGPRIVRVIVTGFQPIHFGFGQERLGGARLFEAPVRWGYRTTPLQDTALNPCPHPLA